MSTNLMSWWKQFKPKACSVKLKAEDKRSVLAEIVTNLVSAGLLEASLEESTLRVLTSREELASTGIGMGVAIPHVKIDGIDEALFCLSVHREGLDWAAVDGEPVQVLFTVLRPSEATDKHDPEVHLDMMRWIAGLARDSDFRSFACQAKTRTELVSLLKEMSPK
jgi:mannitol/fructose-specific phosphotransferase system IIA component (Ntr-type)